MGNYFLNIDRAVYRIQDKLLNKGKPYQLAEKLKIIEKRSEFT